MTHELWVVGAGPGAADQLTPAAAAVLARAGCVVAAARHAGLAGGHPNVVLLKGIAETLDRVEHELERGSVAVLVSGDPGIYSLLPTLRRRWPDRALRVVPGVGSIQSLCAAAGETWEDAAILSGHGRPLSASRLLNTVERRRLTLLFCGGDHSPRWACEALAGAVGGLGARVEAVVGERLSYPDERVTRGTPAELAGRDFDALSLMLVRNPEPWTPPFGRPRDADFERGEVPMTREEVRSVVLDRLELRPDSVLWDVGAGTGSVSAAAALAFPDAEVHAVECVPEAVSLLERNRERFRLHNMTIRPGRALALAGSLPDPTHVFVGGSGGELRELLELLPGRAGAVRVVVAAVTLQTLSEAVTALSGPGYRDLEAVQISVSASRALGRSLLMAARNPVTLLCAWCRPRFAIDGLCP
ncbi:MAG: precorrin-6y C5,15-methyltransferase (decarboxylating) subunit CbiE [Fretibacterium sp.]|nr:precorrin-6y C5,15-methyltransferase (decarboxylating) subunit CbiE [Fretibacterium sp.]